MKRGEELGKKSRSAKETRNAKFEKKILNSTLFQRGEWFSIAAATSYFSSNRYTTTARLRDMHDRGLLDSRDTTSGDVEYTRRKNELLHRLWV
jgi:hypothetical protein